MVDEDREVTATVQVKEISEHNIEHGHEFHFEVLKHATQSYKGEQHFRDCRFWRCVPGPPKRWATGGGEASELEKSTAALQFINEAKLLTSLKHKNIVNLAGFCVHGSSEKLLVYEYLPKKSLNKLFFSLDKYSHGNRGVVLPLHWPPVVHNDLRFTRRMIPWIVSFEIFKIRSFN
ncbi:hypothetical protein EJB05_47980, partial [Eragrostis curvula]